MSHDTDAVLSLCDKAILMDKGSIKAIDSPSKILDQYTKDVHSVREEGKASRAEEINRSNKV